jgi:hypothetical protein
VSALHPATQTDQDRTEKHTPENAMNTQIRSLSWQSLHTSVKTDSSNHAKNPETGQCVSA